MTKVTVLKKDLQKFLLSFGKGLPDVRLSCSGARITAEIAYASFYLRKSLNIRWMMRLMNPNPKSQVKLISTTLIA